MPRKANKKEIEVKVSEKQIKRKRKKKKRSLISSFGSRVKAHSKELFKIGISILVGIMVFGIMMLCAYISYLFNQSILSSIDPNSIRWWHFFTFDEFMAYMLIYDFKTFIIIDGILSSIVIVGIYIGLRWGLD